MGKRRHILTFLKIWILTTDNTVLIIVKGAVEIKLREIRKIFGDRGEKGNDKKKRVQNKLFRLLCTLSRCHQYFSFP